MSAFMPYFACTLSRYRSQSTPHVSRIPSYELAHITALRLNGHRFAPAGLITVSRHERLYARTSCHQTADLSSTDMRIYRAAKTLRNANKDFATQAPSMRNISEP